MRCNNTLLSPLFDYDHELYMQKMKLFTLLPSTLSSPQGHPVLGCDNDVVRRGFFAVLSAASLITDVWVSLFGLDERAQIKLAILSLKAEVSSERRTGGSFMSERGSPCERFSNLCFFCDLRILGWSL